MDACFEVKKSKEAKKIRIRANGIWYFIYVNSEKLSSSKLLANMGLEEVESFTSVFGSTGFELDGGASILVTEDNNDPRYISIWVLNSSSPPHFQEV